MAALATIDELQQRLGTDVDDVKIVDPDNGIDLTDVAQTTLDDLSVEAQFYGSQSWDATTVPPLAKAIVLRAAVRYMKNRDGYALSRSADETVGWGDRVDDHAGSAHFSEAEQRQLTQIASNAKTLSRVGTFGTYSGSNRTTDTDPYGNRSLYTGWADILGRPW